MSFDKTISLFKSQSLSSQQGIGYFIENPEEKESIKMNNEPIETRKKEFERMQALMGKKMQRIEFEIEVFFHKEKVRVQEALEKNRIFNEGIPNILKQLEEFDMAPESLQAFEEAEKLNDIFENDVFLVQQKQAFQQNQKDMTENFKRIENDSYLQAFSLKPFSLELIEQVSMFYESRAEAVFNLMKTMNLFQFNMDDEGWLKIYRIKGLGGFQRAASYEDVKNVEKLYLKIDGQEYTEIMIFVLKFLLENCFEKVSFLCLSFCGRFISNQEARIFNNCISWGDRKMKLTVDFTDCTFESEDTLLIFFQDKIKLLENLSGFKYFLKNTNATQKTIDDFRKLVISRIKNLESFGFDFHNLPLIDATINSILRNGISTLTKLDLSAQRTAFTDSEMIIFSGAVLPMLSNLNEFGLWLDYTQITDKGLLSFFKSLKESCANRLKTVILGISGTNITNESLEYFGCNVISLMENLEDFRLQAESTLVTEKGMVPVLQNIKYFASKLRTFGLDLGSTAIGDEVINALALSVPLMKKLEYFYIWLSGTKITDQGLINLYSSMENFVDIWRFEIDCSETAVTDESLSIFAKRVLPKMAKLKKFAFHANKTKLHDWSVQALFYNLAVAQNQLTTLTISLNETEIGNHSIRTFAKTLSDFSNLKNFNLWLNQTKVEDLSINFLCASLKAVARNLECFSLGLDDTSVTDQGIMKLGKEIAPEMKSLKEFRLRVSKTHVGDASLVPLFENLNGTMGNIHTLQLCLSNSLVGDKSLLALAKESLPCAKSFRSLELRVTDTSVSDLSMVPLVESLKNRVPDLKNLVVSFTRTKITDWSLEKLSKDVIANLRNLRELQFFFGQSQMTGTNMNLFIDNLALRVQNVQKFELGLGNLVNDYQLRSFAYKILPSLTCVQDFKLSWNTSLSDLTYKALCLNAKKAIIRNIKTFDLRPSSFSLTTDPTKVVQKSLQSMYFELSEITDLTMEEIIESFEDQVSQVKIFSFVVNGSKVSDRSLKALANTCFSFMPNLESLTMYLNKLEISNEAFCFMCRSFEHFAKNLKLFKINLDIPNLCNPSLVTLAEYGLTKMMNLENLELHLFYNENVDQALVTLFREMQNCTSKLQSFSLCLPGPKLLVGAIDALATLVFPNMKSLTSFEVGIYDTNMTDSDFILLFSSLKGVLENVESFGLGLSEANLSDQALDVISTEILPQLKNVEMFRCYAANDNKMTSDGWIRFNKRLQEVSQKIVIFMLRLENMGITNEVVNEFALKTLSEMKSLKDADISFGHNSEVNDEGIMNLFDGLGEIVGRLSSLQLGLHYTGLTDVSIKRFKEKLVGSIGQLERFSMNISGNKVNQENRSFINRNTH